MTDKDKEDPKALDAAVDRMRNTLRDGPYIQTVPQDEPRYHHYNRHFAEMWLKDAPFERSEHPDIQYQSWYYKEHGSDLMHLRIHSQLEDGPKISSKVKEDPIKSGMNTPSGGPKKKISLAAYKDKKVNGTGNTSIRDGATPAHDKGRGDRPATADFDGVKREDMANRSRSDKDTLSGTLKRKRLQDSTNSASGRSEDEHKVVTKRVRSPSPDNTNRNSSPEKSQHADTKRKRKDQNGPDLPSRLSPLPMPSSLPGRMSPLEHLPPRLSPTLPPVVVAELERRAASRSSSDMRKETGKNSDDRTGSKHDSVMSGERTTDNKEIEKPDVKRSVDDERDMKRVKREEVQEQESSKSESAPVRVDDQESPKKQKKLLVKLKIPKRLRQDWRRLLHFPPRPAKIHLEEQESSPRPKEQPSQAKAAKPTTPLQPAFQSPPSAQKLPHPTPSRIKDRDLRASIAKPNETPTSPPATTPASSSTITRPSPSSTRTARSNDWLRERDRLFNLAKSFKKAAQDLPAEQSCLLNIESLLAFMLAFHATDASMQTRTPSVPCADAKATWCTLHGFWKFVNRAAEPWPPLAGIVAVVGEVYLARILAWTAVASGDAVRSEEHDAVVMLSRISAAGLGLGLKEIRATFPATWNSVVDDPKPRDKDKEKEEVKPGEYKGTFDLPVGVQSGTIEAVRAVVSMLLEWRLRDGARYKVRLKLSKD